MDEARTCHPSSVDRSRNVDVYAFRVGARHIDLVALAGEAHELLPVSSTVRESSRQLKEPPESATSAAAPEVHASGLRIVWWTAEVAKVAVEWRRLEPTLKKVVLVERKHCGSHIISKRVGTVGK